MYSSEYVLEQCIFDMLLMECQYLREENGDEGEDGSEKVVETINQVHDQLREMWKGRTYVALTNEAWGCSFTCTLETYILPASEPSDSRWICAWQFHADPRNEETTGMVLNFRLNSKLTTLYLESACLWVWRWGIVKKSEERTKRDRKRKWRSWGTHLSS